jgi:FkbM family methyltransferase
MVTLDIGAHVGFYALIAGHANPNGRVFAFEPLALTLERLQRNVADNKLTNVECLERAVGDVSGPVTFFIPDSEIPCSAGMSADFYGAWPDSFAKIEVSAITLDEFVRERAIDRVDLVKIDTESTEPQVLRGMLATLRRDRPAILCEVLRGCIEEGELEKILEPLGYRYYLLTPQGPVLKDRIEGHSDWLNYFFSTLSPQDVAQL